MAELLYPTTDALRALGLGRRQLNRLARLGLLQEEAQSMSRLVALAATVEIIGELDVHLSDEDIRSMVEEVAGRLAEQPSGRDLVLRVVGDYYNVSTFDDLGPLPDRPGAIHRVSFESWVTTARNDLSCISAPEARRWSNVSSQTNQRRPTATFTAAMTQVLLVALGYFAFLRWHHLSDDAGIRVVALVLWLAVLAIAGGWFHHRVATAVVLTVSMTTLVSWDAATQPGNDGTGLWAAGAFFIFLLVLGGSTALAHIGLLLGRRRA